jgi:hypothetical protein
VLRKCGGYSYSSSDLYSSSAFSKSGPPLGVFLKSNTNLFYFYVIHVTVTI